MSGLTIDGIEIPRDIEATKGGDVIEGYIVAEKAGKGEKFLGEHRAAVERAKKAEEAAAKKAEEAAAKKFLEEKKAEEAAAKKASQGEKEE